MALKGHFFMYLAFKQIQLELGCVLKWVEYFYGVNMFPKEIIFLYSEKKPINTPRPTALPSICMH
jgi:hypothetical protein